jgi:hypothetical protein
MNDLELVAVFGSYDDQPADPSFLSQYRNLLHHHVHQTAHTEASTFWAGCGVIRRDVFQTLAGFDQDFGVPSVEDIELGYRLKAAGYRIQLMKSLQVKHLKHWGVISLVTTDFFQRAIPWSRLILRNHWMINDLNLKVSSRFSVLLVYGLVASLLLIPANYKMAGLAMVMVAGLLLLNQSPHRFFLRKRGLWFTVWTVPWLWIYFFYSGLAFAFELLRHGFEVSRSLVVAKTPPSRPCSEVENRSEVR